MFNKESESVYIVPLLNYGKNHLRYEHPSFRTDNGEIVAVHGGNKMLTLKREEQAFTITLTEIE